MFFSISHFISFEDTRRILSKSKFSSNSSIEPSVYIRWWECSFSFNLVVSCPSSIGFRIAVLCSFNLSSALTCSLNRCRMIHSLFLLLPKRLQLLAQSIDFDFVSGVLILVPLLPWYSRYTYTYLYFLLCEGRISRTIRSCYNSIAARYMSQRY